MEAEVDCDCVVVGGGMAGLSAAEELCRAGLRCSCVVTSDLSPPAFISSVRLLEAAPRLGGRAYTTTHGEAVLELGAQWLHGACAANPVFNLAARHGLLGPR